MRNSPPDELRAALTACLGVPRWLDEVSAQAPFETLEDLLAAAREAANPLTAEETDTAMAAHPRIGESPCGAGTAQDFSRREQEAPDANDPVLAAALAAGNKEYEDRFGRVFLIRAAGRTRAEILRELGRRLLLEPEEERAEVGEQLREIALLRIAQLWDRGEAHS